MRKSFFPVAAMLAIAAQAVDKPHSINAMPPESLGFSVERLEHLHSFMQAEIDNKRLAGAVTILARHGKIVDYRTYGQKDIAANAPMAKDVIFRAYSMSKPITGVAMSILFEQGKWLPSDPIFRHLPEFANLKVFKGMDSDGKPILVDPDHPPTMLELMTHTAGFSYGFGHSVVDAQYQAQKVLQSQNLAEMVKKISTIPLLYQPGKAWVYSASMDIQGAIIEKLSGQTLPEFMRRHIFEPLGMNDTGFFVPENKRARFATNYRDTPESLLVSLNPAGQPPEDYSTEPTMPSGGGGLVTTAEDYYRFAQMLANKGELDGKRILSPATVALIMSNHLPAHLLTGEWAGGLHIMRPGFGYGFDGAVVFDPLTAVLPVGKGTYFWDGAAGTWFWVDPTNDIVFVGMIQRMQSKDNHRLLYRSQAEVYQALVDPSK